MKKEQEFGNELRYAMHRHKRIEYILVGIIVVLVGLLIWSHVFYIPQKANRLLTKTYPLLEPGRSVLEQEDLIVNIQPLRETLNTYEQNPKFTIGLYFEYLPTGANISVNKDVEIFPASLLKLPVALAAMKKVENREWNLDNELVLMESDRSAESGNLFKEAVGTRFTIEKLLYESLANSDNTAHLILLRNLSADELNDVYEHLGFENLDKKDTADFTAKRYSVMFRSVYSASYLNPTSAEKILRMLIDSSFKEYLSQGMPKDVLFAHKYGIHLERGIFADSGIVYSKDRPYLITVMFQAKSKDVTEQDAVMLMTEISKTIYDYVSKE